VVILAALLTGNIDPSWLSVISMIVPEPQVRNLALQENPWVKNEMFRWLAV